MTTATYRVALLGAGVSAVTVEATDGADAVRAARAAHPEARATLTVSRVDQPAGTAGKGTTVRR